MPKSRNQKLKLLRLKDILEHYTDDDIKLSTKEIIEKLAEYDIQAERKSIYDDIDCLELYGLDIIKEKTDSNRYFVGSRTFELPELKLLVDSVQSSKFLTVKKSDELIKKLESLCSKNQAASLHRQVFVSNRIKNMNESIYFVIDEIHNAILNDNKIEFKYTTYSVDKVQTYKNNGAIYSVSPYALLLEEQNYYLLGFDSQSKIFKHFRVDKIADVKTSESKREGKEEFKSIDLAKYSKKFFSMFGGEEQNIKLQVNNELIGVVIERFGKNVFVTDKKDETFCVNIDVAVSQKFFGWISSFGGKINVVSPDNVVEEYKNYLQNILNFYK